MNPRAALLIADLHLVPHPEGGYYGEIHRSASRVRPRDGRQERAALTTIYFLLASGDVSRWHCVSSDEAWHHYEGAPLDLFTADPAFHLVARERLGPLHDDGRPVAVVPAGHWQAARTTGAYTLVGCTVGPGFDFADFRLLRDHPAEADRVRREHPDASGLI